MTEWTENTLNKGRLGWSSGSQPFFGWRHIFYKIIVWRHISEIKYHDFYVYMTNLHHLSLKL
jgi:hypothetical protein